MGIIKYTRFIFKKCKFGFLPLNFIGHVNGHGFVGSSPRKFRMGGKDSPGRICTFDLIVVYIWLNL